MKTSLNTHILHYLKNKDGFVNGGELEILGIKLGYKGSTASRCARKLAEDQRILREERQGPRARSVWYRSKDPMGEERQCGNCEATCVKDEWFCQKHL